MGGGRGDEAGVCGGWVGLGLGGGGGDMLKIVNVCFDILK